MSLGLGDTAPVFVLKNQNGQDFDISTLLGIKPFVIFFYPKDFTPGCTKEACSFRDHFEDFKDLGAEVIGISGDSEVSHQRFTAKHHLPYILLSDRQNRIRKLFGVSSNFFGLIPGRETFVFCKDGRLIFRFNSINATEHINKALLALKQVEK